MDGLERVHGYDGTIQGVHRELWQGMIDQNETYLQPELWSYQRTEPPVETEEWRDIPDCDRYKVSSLGRFRNKYSGKVFIPYKGDCGYGQVNLYKNNGKQSNQLAHRVIAKVFISQPEGCHYVNHLNHDRMDNRVCNLEWTTHSENMRRTKKARPVIHRFDFSLALGSTSLLWPSDNRQRVTAAI